MLPFPVTYKTPFATVSFSEVNKIMFAYGVEQPGLMCPEEIREWT